MHRPGNSIIHIALPMLHYPILVAVLLRTIDAFRVYDLIFMMTLGGPINATDTLKLERLQRRLPQLQYGICRGALPDHPHHRHRHRNDLYPAPRRTRRPIGLTPAKAEKDSMFTLGRPSWSNHVHGTQWACWRSCSFSSRSSGWC